MGTLKKGREFIKRAIELEQDNRLNEALNLYQEGLEIFLQCMLVAPDAEKSILRTKINQYMSRAEVLKSLIDTQAKYHKEIVIENDSTGHGYETIFGSYLTSDVKIIKIEDTYIHQHFQFINLLRFCELVVKKCENLHKIILITKSFNDNNQTQFFQSLTQNLREYGITFVVHYSSTIHDRQISFSNGWIILPGRGLDFYKPPKSQNSIGSYDLDLRPCRETKIHIHFQQNLQL